MIGTVKIQLQHTTQLSYPCISFGEFNEIEDNYNIMPYNYDTVCLDEVQFMDTKECVFSC